MSQHKITTLVLVFATGVLSCAPTDVSDVAVDAGTPADVLAPSDVALVADAALQADVGPAPGFGVISGECDVLDDELIADAPTFITNAIDFADNAFDESESDELTAGGQEVLADGNAGGSSLFSEIFSYEILERCENASLLKTETEVAIIDPQGSLTDLLIDIDGVKLGVSVTRAIAFPFDDPYSVEQARTLLDQKLQGVLDSSANVAPEDEWQKQILHIIAYSDEHREALESAYANVDAALKADTIVYVSVSDGDDLFLYQN